ncbi:ATP-binding protein [Lysobacter gilvus]|uniref:AAA family ATPase n=1 Tax=Noviluteimonas gilva TaxID=2682097 RepID=A0A7C9LJA9_9GAMM|nr:AAA family ATPase [Lysobacter gilvus]
MRQSPGGRVGKIVYITGAPATGKSTLCDALASDPRVVVFSYSLRLRDHISRQSGDGLTEVDVRSRSAQIITPTHVAEIDDILLAEARTCRDNDKVLLIDSHPVTKEDFGFRVTPFKTEQLARLEVDRFLCLYASPEELERRITRSPEGRPRPSLFELSMHVELQASVVATYAILSGRPCHLIDSGIPRDELVLRVRALIGMD